MLLYKIMSVIEQESLNNINIEFIDKEKGKLKVEILIFGRPTTVELDETQIRK